MARAKGHRFYAPDPSRDLYECESCGSGNFTGQQIAAEAFFPCSHYIDRQKKVDRDAA